MDSAAQQTKSGESPCEKVYDVIVIGAGISGIHAAYQIQRGFPTWDYTVLEGRKCLGGTWDLFRYPGIRSDSDLYTFGFPWFPWSEKKAFAQGDAIKEYITKAAASFGIDEHIQFETKVHKVVWSSDQHRWRVDTISTDGQSIKSKAVFARFLIFGTGYYNYDQPLHATIPGIEQFQGQLIHPQFWPEDVDYCDKRIAVIGSGATAVTLVPELAKKARLVTMVQRSPGYIIPRRTIDALESVIQFVFIWKLAQSLLRWKNIFVQLLFYQFCVTFPNAARAWLARETAKNLPPQTRLTPHFKPKYNPWEQRLCVCPDGDFFAVFREGKADIQTGNITSMSGKTIRLDSGQEISADIIVTATGLKVQFAGGIKIYLDDTLISPHEKFTWNGIMVEDLPNCWFLIGSTNLSWTLGIDNSMKLASRVLGRVVAGNFTVVVPKISQNEIVKQNPLITLKSTYLKVAKNELPKAGDRGPWAPRSSYYKDFVNCCIGDFEASLEFS
ncbi:uncharacterized protein N7496_007427 [Penicillium cataractarum]|uniref:FAD/NAD(P)-binding domain-containing protein n=1 Tax=Penicillium cataractarum TaxID=2100454 RepID=A0A9W9V9H1_9EURO|nr:uncharacterized protein N7496_007427 [Penicillium cataractarum]KAJ5371335.1 hypothetical protein N7496_007427 [Penicillium cataractarum]